MKYCISKNTSLDLLLKEQKISFFRDIIFNPDSNFNLEEKQKLSVDRLSKKTFFQELYFSLLLSDFYFGQEADTRICFDMVEDFDPKRFDDEKLTFTNLEKWIEVGTPSDCYIVKGLQELKFQIKSYPEKYGKDLSTNKIVDYVQNLSQTKYGDMSDIILVLIIQVEKPWSTLPTDLQVLNARLNSLKPKFKEIVLPFNIEGRDSLFSAYKISS